MLAALAKLAALVVTLIPSTSTFVTPDGSHGAASSTAVERIEEDDPRWDCATMGNRVCGPDAPPPVATDVVPLVVVAVWAECDPTGPFPFQYLGPVETMPDACRVIGEVTQPG